MKLPQKLYSASPRFWKTIPASFWGPVPSFQVLLLAVSGRAACIFLLTSPKSCAQLRQKSCAQLNEHFSLNIPFIGKSSERFPINIVASHSSRYTAKISSWIAEPRVTQSLQVGSWFDLSIRIGSTLDRRWIEMSEPKKQHPFCEAHFFLKIYQARQFNSLENTYHGNYSLMMLDGDPISVKQIRLCFRFHWHFGLPSILPHNTGLQESKKGVSWRRPASKVAVVSRSFSKTNGNSNRHY